MGLRVGEVLALKIDDIDFNKNLLNVDKTVTTDINNHLKLSKYPKTTKGIRILPIPKFLIKYIKEQIEFDKNVNNPDNLLFPPINSTTNEILIPHTTINKAFKRILNILDINETGFSTHSLRHTYTTRLVESGLDLEQIKDLLGHTDKKLTIKYYTTVFERFRYSELKRLFEFYKENNLFNYDFDIDLEIISKKIEDCYE